MTLTRKEYEDYKARNDHSWYQGKKFKNSGGDVLIVRNLNYETDLFEYKFINTGDSKNESWVPTSSRVTLFNALLKNCSYYSRYKKLRLQIESMRNRF